MAVMNRGADIAGVILAGGLARRMGGDVPDLRTAGFIVSISRIAASYQAKGL